MYLATTRLIPLHVGKGRTIAEVIKESTDYLENPEKTQKGELVTSFECDPMTVDAEFLLSKRQYFIQTGRDQGERDVIAYHTRQSFKPGEITPEEANEIGRELALRFTKGRHAFIVATHIDKAHIHNHIIFNSTALGYEVKRGKHLVFKVPGADRFTRCRESTLGKDYTEDAIRDRIAGRRQRDAAPTFRRGGIPQVAPQKPSLLIDIQARLQAGKGAGYERWAKIFNLKQAAQTLNYLQEHGGMSYEELAEKTASVTARFNSISGRMKELETALNDNATLQKHIVNYSKTRAVYIEYRKTGYSKRFREAHEAEILLHQTAKKHFDSLGLPKLPTVASLRSAYVVQLEEKKTAYREYRQARDEMRELLVVKANVDRLLNMPGYQLRREPNIPGRD